MDLLQAGNLVGNYNGVSDDDKCDWIVLVKWERSVDKNQAIRLNPVVPSTASRIYEHRKELIGKIRHDLGLSA
jgi:hypothetical protein